MLRNKFQQTPLRRQGWAEQVVVRLSLSTVICIFTYVLYLFVIYLTAHLIAQAVSVE
jgi:hypothetical protein